VLLNPNSRKNRARPCRGEKLQGILGDYGIVRQTRSVEDIPSVLEEFFDRKIPYWVSDGGDGALHWMINTGMGLSFPGEIPGPGSLFGPIVVPTNGGTIDFVAKKAGIKGYAEQILKKLIVTQKTGAPVPLTRVDSLRIRGKRLVDSGIEPFEKIGFAAAVGGIGQKFFDKYYAEEALGPRAIVAVISKAVSSFFLGGLPGTSRLSPGWKSYAEEIFRPEQATVCIDGHKLDYDSYGAIHAGSLDIDLGGVIRVFGMAAEQGDIQFQAGSIRPIEMIGNLPNLFSGKKIRSSRLVDTIGNEMSVYAGNASGLRPVIDGEMFEGVTELHITAGPKINVPRIP
jgi:hypothetical protein